MIPTKLNMQKKKKNLIENMKRQCEFSDNKYFINYFKELFSFPFINQLRSIQLKQWYTYIYLSRATIFKQSLIENPVLSLGLEVLINTQQKI